MIVTQRQREREAETQAEGEAGSMHQEPDVGFDPRSPGSRPGPKAGAKPLRHPGFPNLLISHIEQQNAPRLTQEKKKKHPNITIKKPELAAPGWLSG